VSEVAVGVAQLPDWRSHARPGSPRLETIEPPTIFIVVVASSPKSSARLPDFVPRLRSESRAFVERQVSCLESFKINRERRKNETHISTTAADVQIAVSVR